MTQSIDQLPMEAAMMQAFLRDVTGEFDVSRMEVLRLQPGRMLVMTPEGEDIVVECEAER